MYIEAAVALASNLTALAKIRSGLRERMAQSPLCNGKMFTQALEHTYRDKWQVYVDKRKAQGTTPTTTSTTTTNMTTNGRTDYLPIGATMTSDGKVMMSGAGGGGEMSAAHAGADGPTSKSKVIRAPTPTEYAGAGPPFFDHPTNSGGTD